MPSAQAAASVGLAIAAGVLLLAGLFAARQRAERRGREADLTAADAAHFARKDARRFLGSAIMALVAAGMAWGVLINPRAGRGMARLFGAVWVVVTLLVCAMLVLALLDWIANRDYALRHRRALAEERRALFESELRRRAVPSNGRADPHGPAGGTPPG